ncbi:methyltransferase domain-containing protein [Aureococcus anophagefferens]|nr:methyltransferase domain-containing protein [Aureococcus anophagefferens]
MRSRSSSLVTVDVWPDAATAARFLKNVRASANARKVDVRKGDSALRVAELLLAGREFDFIYVDGSHRATDVLLDVSLAWRLLRSDGRGVMLLDDARGEPAPAGL